MSKLKLNITMSIDGFVAGPNQSPENPLGIGGEELHNVADPAQGVPRESRRRGRRGQREHAVRRGHPRRRRGDDHGPEHVRRRPRAVGRVVARLVGRRPAVSPSGLRLDAPSTRAARDAGRNDVPLRHGWDRVGARAGARSSGRSSRCRSAAARPSRSSTSRRVCSTSSSSPSSRCCSEAGRGSSRTRATHSSNRSIRSPRPG